MSAPTLQRLLPDCQCADCEAIRASLRTRRYRLLKILVISLWILAAIPLVLAAAKLWFKSA